MTHKESAISGRSKVEHYKWTMQDVSEPGEMKLVPKGEIITDHAYQRQANEMKVRCMAAEFSWVAFGAITVNRRGGKLYVMDGQHRLEAASRRDDIQNVPCIIYNLPSTREEASGFLSLNSNRKPVSSVDKFKAQIVSGVEVTIFVDSLVNQSGRVVSKCSAPTTIVCIGLLQTLAKEDQRKLAKLWPTICEVSKGRSMHVDLIRALWHVEGKLSGGHTFTDGKWREKLIDVGCDAVMEEIRKAAGYHGNRSPSTLAEGLLKAVNRRLRIPLMLEAKV